MMIVGGLLWLKYVIMLLRQRSLSLLMLVLLFDDKVRRMVQFANNGRGK
jgi:hypothetical protein